MTSTLTRIILFSFLLLLFIPHRTSAETKTFIKEYTCQSSDEDSRNSCKTISLMVAKRLLLDDLCTYMEGQTEVKNLQMTKDQIITLTAGIVNADVLEDKWDGKVYWFKAIIAANPQVIMKGIDKLRNDVEIVKELDELRKKSEELLRENERLNKELRVAKSAKKKELLQLYKRNIDNLSAIEWFEKGYEFKISDNNTNAVKAFSMTIDLNPQYSAAYNNRAIAYSNLGNNQQAIKDYNKAIELNPQYSRAYAGRGDAENNLGNNQQSIKDLNKAIELNPLYSTAYFYRGCVYNNLGNDQQAIKDYNKAIELNPLIAEVYYDRGLIYTNHGDYKQAIADYSKAIELNSQFALAYNNRGVVYGRLGNYQQSMSDYNKAKELNPQQIKALSNNKAGREASAKECSRLFASQHNFYPVITLEGEGGTTLKIEDFQLSAIFAYGFLISGQTSEMLYDAGFKQIIFVKQIVNSSQFIGWIWDVCDVKNGCRIIFRPPG